VVVGGEGLGVGGSLGESVLLQSASGKAMKFKGSLVGLLVDEGGFGVVGVSGTGTKASYSRQDFDDGGVVVGKATKLSLSLVLDLESKYGEDLNGDTNIGDTIDSVVDGDGYVGGSSSYGLYKTASLAYVLDEAGLVEGGSLTGEQVMLKASASKLWTVKGFDIVGIAQKDSGYIEILTKKGASYSAYRVDEETGIVGKAAKVKPADLAAREYYYDLDLNGINGIELIGATTPPTGWEA